MPLPPPWHNQETTGDACFDAVLIDHIGPLGMQDAVFYWNDQALSLGQYGFGPVFWTGLNRYVVERYVVEERLPLQAYNDLYGREPDTSCECHATIAGLFAAYPSPPYVGGGITPEQAEEVETIRDIRRRRRIFALILGAAGALALARILS